MKCCSRLTTGERYVENSQRPQARESGEVVSIGNSGAVRRRIIDMGITPGAVIIMRKAAPFETRWRSMCAAMSSACARRRPRKSR